MKITALCVRLMMNVWMVLAAQLHCSYCAQEDDAVFPRLLPNRLQFFEYESISLTCGFDGSAGWRVMRTLQEISPTNVSNWVQSAGSGTIRPAFSSDSGAYWCEDGDGLGSRAVNISVTAGSVILESPVMPVNEGDHVTLRCRKKKSPAVIADFYKDGLLIRTSYTGNMTICNVSKSDEGLYKCNISGAGESPESRLAVGVLSEPHEETQPPHSPATPSKPVTSSNVPTLLWIVVPVVLVALLLLLLVLGVLHCRRIKVSRGDSSVDSHHSTYAAVKKPRREKVLGGDEDAVDLNNATYALVTKANMEKEPKVSKARRTKPHLPEENEFYSSVNFTGEPKVSKARRTKPHIPEENVIYSSVNFTGGNVSHSESRHS